MNIGIIGGGVSGVSVASKLSLLKNKGADIDITLFEANEELGGTMKTINKDGFLIESGSNGFLDSKPFTLDTFKEALLFEKLVKSNATAKKRYIQRYNALQRVPENARMFLTSKLISLKGKLRLAGEFFVPKRQEESDETLSHFAIRRLGQEALDFMIAPMVSGVFAGDPDKMSLKSSFPVIYDLESTYGGLIKGMIKKKNKKGTASGPSGTLTSYQGGMGQAVKDLAEFAKSHGVQILTSSAVRNVEMENNQYKVEVHGRDNSFFFDKLIIACPAYESASIFKDFDHELSNTLSSIPYAPMFVAGLGFHNDDLESKIDGFGYLIPEKEGRKILGTLFTSSMFPMQAPHDAKFLRVMCGGDKRHDIIHKSDEELLQDCIDGVSDILGVKNKPFMVQTFKFEHAIPQYHVGHSQKVATIEKLLANHKGLYIGGNILYGISLNDCTKVSGLIASNIEKELGL